MNRQRRTLSTDLKRGAATLILDQGYTVVEACQKLGLVESALRRWGKALRINRLERENAILKG